MVSKKTMRTPAGFECSYFFGDYFRGKNHEECRLIGNVPPPNQWTRDLCKSCPVPGIQRANSCQNMNLSARVNRQFFGLRKQVEVKAFCMKRNCPVTDPYIGCGECHVLPEIFIGKNNE
jgi:hypothetical protein